MKTDANAPAPQERAALSEPRVGAYTDAQLSEVRRHHADAPCVITGTHETCRLLATVNEREEALQRVRDLCENKAVNEMVKNAPWNAVYDLARAIRVAIEAALATPRDGK